LRKKYTTERKKVRQSHGMKKYDLEEKRMTRREKV